LVDVCGEAGPVLFGFFLSIVSLYGLFVVLFGESLEFKDQLKSKVLYVSAVFVGEGAVFSNESSKVRW